MEMSATLQSCPCSTLPLAQQLRLQPCRPKVPALRPFPRPRRTAPALLSKYGRWDSNAEDMGPSKGFGFDSLLDGDDPGSWRIKRRWWSGDPEDEEEDDEEEEMGIVEEVIDSIWILKVFRSYGWAIPAILLSLLLATGPKAFLMAMALPLGQSAVTLAYNRLSGRKWTRSRVQTLKRRRRRKRSSNAVSNTGKEVQGRDRNWNTRNGNSGAGSRVEDEIFSSEFSNGTASFGGWEELDGMQSGEKSSGVFDRSGAKMEVGSRKLSGENAPSLLRLLVTMFPFLGFWINMFW